MTFQEAPPPPSWSHRPIQFALKRTMDYALAGVAMVIVAPLAAAIAVAIRLDSPGPVLFRQERLGLGTNRFVMIKFRTMRDGAPIRYNADGSTNADPGDDRITRVGKVLRGGLDELPQLLNVIRGEMSLVGPRPDLPEHESLYTAAERRKRSVRPGITNLPAVLGRNENPWKTRIALDLYYIDHWSLTLDIKIMIATLFMPFGVRPFTFAKARRHVALELTD